MVMSTSQPHAQAFYPASSKLRKQYPGRSKQIGELLSILGGPCDPIPPLLICGPHGSGKTSIVRDSLLELERPFVWSSVQASGVSPQWVMEDILTQLSGVQDSSWNKQSKSVSSFLGALPIALERAKQTQEGQTVVEPSSFEGSDHPTQETGVPVPVPAAGPSEAKEQGGAVIEPGGRTGEDNGEEEKTGSWRKETEEDSNKVNSIDEPQQRRSKRIKAQSAGNEAAGSLLSKNLCGTKKSASAVPNNAGAGRSAQPVPSTADAHGSGTQALSIADPSSLTVPVSAQSRIQLQSASKEDPVTAKRSLRFSTSDSGAGGCSETPRVQKTPCWDSKNCQSAGESQCTNAKCKLVESRQNRENCRQLNNDNLGRNGADVGEAEHPILKSDSRQAGARSTEGDFSLRTPVQGQNRDVPISEDRLQPVPLERHAKQATIYLVVDNVEHLSPASERGTDSGTALIDALLRLPELTGLRHVAVILIGQVEWALQLWMFGRGGHPLPVFFPGYSPDDLEQILKKQRPGDNLYHAFLRQVGPPFTRVYRSLPDLASALEPLWQAYSVSPVAGVNSRPTTTNKSGDQEKTGSQRLSLEDSSIRFNRIASRVSLHQNHPLECVLRESGAALMENAKRGQGWRQGIPRTGIQITSSGVGGVPRSSHFRVSGEVGESRGGLALPVLAQFALLAAYICSRNPAADDNTLFENGHMGRSGASSRKRARRENNEKQEKREREIREAQSQGPALFTLQRWMGVCRSIIAADGTQHVNPLGTMAPPLDHSRGVLAADPGRDECGHQDQRGEGGGKEWWGDEDLMLLMSCFVEAGFLGLSKDDVMDVCAKHWCRFSRLFAFEIASSIRFPLERYLLHD